MGTSEVTEGAVTIHHSIYGVKSQRSEVSVWSWQLETHSHAIGVPLAQRLTGLNHISWPLVYSYCSSLQALSLFRWSGLRLSLTYRPTALFLIPLKDHPHTNQPVPTYIHLEYKAFLPWEKKDFDYIWNMKIFKICWY